jgi:hypothetical protein
MKTLNKRIGREEYITCSGLWNISMNGYSFLCRVIQKPGYFGHSTWRKTTPKIMINKILRLLNMLKMITLKLVKIIKDMP